MPKSIMVQVADNVLFSTESGQEIEIESVVSVSVPEISFPTKDISGSGMAGKMNMPLQDTIEAGTFTIKHNNGTNTNLLLRAGRRGFDFREAVRRYNTAAGEFEIQDVKHHLYGALTKAADDDREKEGDTGGSSEYALLRYERYVEGREVIYIDIPAGILRLDGVDLRSAIKSMLR